MDGIVQSYDAPHANLFPLSNYTFNLKSPRIEKDKSVAERFERMKRMYDEQGRLNSVEGVLIVHQHNHPHVLLLRIGTTFYKLPGGRLKPGEDDISGLKRKLNNKLAPEGQELDWEIGDLMCNFWRPHFDQTQLPYMPPHVTKPKECRKIFFVHMPENADIYVPRNLNLIAVPIFELFENSRCYGPLIATIPLLLGRFNFNYIPPPSI
eukprot:TRINITY_DN6329_c0_g1_i1.p1 TRINITY_DN6329_c0_g1~~TRINITY_DN6329_c0_g1_i1.p1  ORF type:complete len:218 (-),score=74.12 TRINITY_DN6329_c0_g1_i1:10-633(-)